MGVDGVYAVKIMALGTAKVRGVLYFLINYGPKWFGTDKIFSTCAFILPYNNHLV